MLRIDDLLLLNVDNGDGEVHASTNDNAEIATKIDDD